MPKSAISVQGLSKKYRIDVRGTAPDRITESLAALATRSLRRTSRSSRKADFWALRDVSFEVARGSSVGIIGRNGAGKSTLLKILSRITDPTEGRIELRGTMGSLLEVGTGFHPELSGRENIYLSGAILGMGRRTIDRKFGEIVDFADIGDFLDTPIKRYSSGMKVRLGFAVAAFLEPDILFIDEVLAVGDANFQRKSLGKISELGGEGRTVMFVSHSMPAVLRLCERAILLDQGRVVADGPSHQVVKRYLESDTGKSGERRWPDAESPGDAVARLRNVRVIPAGAGTADEVDIRQPVDIEVTYWSENPNDLRPSVNLRLYNDDGICIFVTSDWTNRVERDRPRARGLTRATCRIPGNFLAEGRVTVTVGISTINPTVAHVFEHDVVAFQVVDRSAGDGVRGDYVNEWPGVVRPLLEWKVEGLGVDG